MWRPAVKRRASGRPEAVDCGGTTATAGKMAKVSLRHLKKVFPNEEKKRSKNDQERRNNLQVTAEGRDVIAIVPTAGGRVGYTPVRRCI